MKQYILYLLIILFSLIGNFTLFAQRKQVASDTSFHFEDKYLYKQQRFYNKWKAQSERHRWSKELFNLLCDSPTATTPKPISSKSIAESLKEYEGMRIAKINFEVVKPFGQRIGGLPTDSTDNKFEYLGNKLHTSTKVAHLRRLLSFQEGSVLDINQLEDNEENLRNAPYIDELYIYVTPLSENSIALNFLIKDKFSWSASYQAQKLDSHKLKIYNKNLFGRGHAVKYQYYYAPSRRITNNHKFTYYIPSIGKSLINSTTTIERTYHQNKYGLAFERPFIDYKTNTAAGLRANFVRNTDNVPTNYVARFPNTINYREMDAWAGFTLPFDLDMSDKYARYRKAITGRFYHLHFSKHPEIKIDSNAYLMNLTGAFLAYNVSKRKLYLSNMMYEYGKVENIPYGYLVQLVAGGIVTRWNQRKGYLGFNFERAYYNQNHDYFFSMKLSAGTFFSRREFLEGALNAEFRYISKLYRFRNIGHRHFLKLRYVMGLNSTDNFVNLDERNGIRNFKSDIVQGDRKLVLNIEDVFFSPFTIAGFRTAFFSFADLAYLSKSNHVFRNDGHVYTGIGLGLRLHNDNFIFKTFQMSFSFFLNAPDDVHFFTPDAGSVKGERFNDFQISKPEVYWESLN